jgi:hypothetical protein
MPPRDILRHLRDAEFEAAACTEIDELLTKVGR